MSSIFGGSKSKSKSTQSSYNKAFDTISQAYTPMLEYSKTGGDLLSRFLGGDASGFDAYKQNTGYDFALDRGQGNITARQIGNGLFRSGSTLKRLQQFGAGLNQGFADNYIQRLLGLAGLGNQAAGNIIGAGNYSAAESTSTSRSSPGIGGFLGGMASGIAGSDRRLKNSIKKLGEFEEDGLGIYSFRYNADGEDGPEYIGVMADEVAALRPWALGPVTDDGFMTVNYEEL